MDNIFTDQKWSTFFGVLILFFSVAGLLGYIPKELVINGGFLVLFILGVILGGLLVERGIAPYFVRGTVKTVSAPAKKRKRR